MADGGPMLGGAGPCLQHLLAAQARATPKAPALSFEDGATLSYEELDTRAQRIATVLRTLGVRRDKLVGVRLPRCLGAVVGMVGVLKAGGAYVAIDTCFPPDRQAHILLESGLLVLLVPRGTAARAREEAGPRVAVVELGPLGEVWEVWPARGVESQGGADASFLLGLGEEEGGNKEQKKEEEDVGRSLAYVLYTSGSTGKPKGVMVEHRGVVSLLAYFKEQLGMGPGDTVLGLTTFCFDISVLEIFGPLVTGGRLCLVSAATQKDPGAILDLMERERISLLQATPATFEMLMLTGWQGHKDVHCICGGEAFRLNLLPLVAACASFRNGYGPTEATVYTTTYKLPTDRLLDAVPIGTALPGLRLYVLGEDLQPKPVGEAGELYVAGTGVARGYLNRPDLTAERFLPDPFVQGPEEGKGGELMYRTGDEVKWVMAETGGVEEEMVLAYLGRMDSQVKINGFRIELGEIEKVLQQHPGVGGAVVCCREDVPGRAKALVGYIMPTTAAMASGPPSPAELRVHLGRALPPYMIPDFYVFLSVFPLSPNGKVDRKALPPPEVGGRGTSSRKDWGNPLMSPAAAGSASRSDSSMLSGSFDYQVDDDEDDNDSEEQEEEAEDDDEEMGKMSRHHHPPSILRLVSRLVREQSGAEVNASSSMSAIGLDSLGTVVILSKLSSALGGLRVPPAAVFEYETVGEFAAYLGQRVAQERPDLMDSLGMTVAKEDKKEGFLLNMSDKQPSSHSRQGRHGSSSSKMLAPPAPRSAQSSSSLVGNVASLTSSLTGLRGVLILWVVAEHFIDRAIRPSLGFRFSSNTWIFVLLSGFTASLQAEGSQHGRWRWKSFLWSKALGLFPIYYVAALLTLPRYLGVTKDPVAFTGKGWHHHGVLRTNYLDGPWTYCVDALFLLTGMQTWVEEVNHRSMNTLYYASVQWNLYLFFALAMGLWQHTGQGGPNLFARVERTVGGPFALWCLVACATLGSLTLACHIHPHYLHSFWPILYLPAFIVGMMTAHIYTCYRPRVARFAEALLSPPTPTTTTVRAAGADTLPVVLVATTTSNTTTTTSALRLSLAGKVWAHAGDALAALTIFFVLGPWGQHTADQNVCLLAVPLVAALFVLVTSLQGTKHKSFIKTWILDAEWAGILGRLSYAIYLFHEAIGDVYMQMAVKQYYKQWHSLLPPPGTDWYTKYELYVSPWMSTQSLVLKFAALSLSIVFGWVVSTYLIDRGLMPLLGYGGQTWRRLKRVIMKRRGSSRGEKKRRGRQSHRSRASTEDTRSHHGADDEEGSDGPSVGGWVQEDSSGGLLHRQALKRQAKQQVEEETKQMELAHRCSGTV